MKLSDLSAAVKEAEKFCKLNKIEDPDVVVDLDEDGGYYNLESLDADTRGEGEIVINLKSSNES